MVGIRGGAVEEGTREAPHPQAPDTRDSPYAREPFTGGTRAPRDPGDGGGGSMALFLARHTLSGTGAGCHGRGPAPDVSEVDLTLQALGERGFSRLLDLGLACLDLSYVEMREFVVWGRPPASEAAVASTPGSLFRSHSSAYWLSEVERPGGLVRWARSSLTLAPHLGPSLLSL